MKTFLTSKISLVRIWLLSEMGISLRTWQSGILKAKVQCSRYRGFIVQNQPAFDHLGGGSPCSERHLHLHSPYAIAAHRRCT